MKVKVKETFIVELNFEEAVALKKWLGQKTAMKAQEAGICKEQSATLSCLYDLLPHEED